MEQELKLHQDNSDICRGIISAQAVTVHSLTEELQGALDIIREQRETNTLLSSDLGDALTACRTLAKRVVTSRRKSHSRKRQLDQARRQVEIYKGEYKKLKREYKKVGQFWDDCAEAFNANHRLTDTENDDL